MSEWRFGSTPHIRIPCEFLLKDTQRRSGSGYTELRVQWDDDEGINAILSYFFQRLFRERVPVSHANVGFDVDAVSGGEGLFDEVCLFVGVFEDGRSSTDGFVCGY